VLETANIPITQGSLHVKTTHKVNAHLQYKGIVHFEIITVNQAFYVEILNQFHEAVCRKRPELRPTNWILYHDDAPADKVLSAISGPQIN
jgi:hypothetical protein